jgi:hypothetical protein
MLLQITMTRSVHLVQPTLPYRHCSGRTGCCSLRVGRREHTADLQHYIEILNCQLCVSRLMAFFLGYRHCSGRTESGFQAPEC